MVRRRSRGSLLERSAARKASLGRAPAADVGLLRLRRHRGMPEPQSEALRRGGAAKAMFASGTTTTSSEIAQDLGLCDRRAIPRSCSVRHLSRARSRADAVEEGDLGGDPQRPAFRLEPPGGMAANGGAAPGCCAGAERVVPEILPSGGSILCGNSAISTPSSCIPGSARPLAGKTLPLLLFATVRGAVGIGACAADAAAAQYGAARAEGPC